VLLFLFSFVIAGIMMAWARGAAGIRSVFDRIVGIERGERFTRLCTSTIRAVAQGVLGVALIQAIVVGLLLLFAGIPFAGVLAAIVLVLGIAQLPALLVTLPVIAYIWWSPLRHRHGDHAHRAARARRHARQHPEAAAARPRRRGADAGDPDRRARRHGDQRHPRHVPRRDLPRPRLPDLHVVGRREPDLDVRAVEPRRPERSS
jgi:hypothetical protein